METPTTLDGRYSFDSPFRIFGNIRKFLSKLYADVL